MQTTQEHELAALRTVVALLKRQTALEEELRMTRADKRHIAAMLGNLKDHLSSLISTARSLPLTEGYIEVNLDSLQNVVTEMSEFDSFFDVRTDRGDIFVGVL